MNKKNNNLKSKKRSNYDINKIVNELSNISVSEIEKIGKIIPDTSALIEEVLSNLVENYDLDIEEIIIHEATLAELRHQASSGKITGTIGLSEIENLRNLSKKYGFELSFMGKRPSSSEIQFAPFGEIDNKIIDLASDLSAVLITLDKVQAQVAKAKGVKVLFFEQKKELEDPIKDFFNDKTMSVHIKANNKVLAKKGSPGKIELVEISDEVFSSEMVKELAKKIVEYGKVYGYIDQESSGLVVLQINKYRIVITKPPLSEDYEITIVKPVKKLELKDYNLEESIIKRLDEEAAGILVAGAPGSGKSTFIQALINYYYSKSKIIKTIESPRDLDTPVGVTQYSLKVSEYDEIRDILLLSRPDYVFFDEVRNVPDFNFYSDLRLAGVGMVGVVHATKAIDAIQRFIGKLELGMIPSILDTVIFIKDGKVDKVYSLTYSVKVPSGMEDDDLARPVIEVRDYLNNNLEFEIYTFGEETVVMPVNASNSVSKIQEYAEKEVEKEIKRITGIKGKVRFISDNAIDLFIKKKDIPHIIGKGGKNIDELEEKLGLSINVKNLDELEDADELTNDKDFEIFEDKSNYYLKLNNNAKMVDLFINGELVTRATVGKDNEISFSKKSRVGKLIKKALKNDWDIEVKEVK